MVHQTGVYNLTIKVGAGGGLPKLAANLTYPNSKSTNNNYITVSGIDATGSLTTLLSLTGKYSIPWLQIQNMLAEAVTVKLTIDSVVIWNESYTNAGTGQSNFFGSPDNQAGVAEAMQCDSSLLFELQTTTDTSVILNYLARPLA